jgi:hypothetical protein
MTKQTLMVLLLIVFLISACSPAPAATEPPTPAPTNTPLPPPPTATATEPPTATPIPPTPTPEFLQYYTEEFDKDLKYWPFFVVDHSRFDPVINKEPSDKVVLSVADGFFKFDIGKTWQYVYSYYEPFEYADVRLDARVENLGTNDNNVSLICRYTPDVGWYEFNIANSGILNILYAKIRPEDGYVSYTLISEGGSNKIVQGHGVNEYTAICQGENLTLYINDNLTREVKDNRLTSGKVGISVSSFPQLPVLINIDWIKISEPE